MVKRTDVVRGILWIVLIGLAIVWAYKYTKLIQGFQDPPQDEEKQLTEQVTAAMTQVSELLCPILKDVLEKKTSDLMTDEEEEKGFAALDSQRKGQLQAEALQNFRVATLGLVFPCPPPTNTLEIPMNIQNYIIATARACLPTVAEIKENTAKARSCPPTKEGFELNIPIALQHSTQEAYQDIVSAQNELIRKNRILGLQTKLQGIKDGLLNPSTVQLTTDYKEVKQMKAEAEAGTLTPNCAL
jgi:hypothetical protein